MPENEVNIGNLTDKFKSLADEEACQAFEADLDKFEKNLQQQISVIQGQMQAVAVVKRLLKAHKQVRTTNTETREKEEYTPIASKEDEERLKRLKNNSCTFKDRKPPHGTGKWCERKLRSKKEKENGYCTIHQKVLGLEDPED